MRERKFGNSSFRRIDMEIIETENKKTMELAIIWARVSTKDQAEGFSLNAQVKLLREYATKHNLRIVKEFIVPESARGKQERKKFQEMLDYLDGNSKIKHVLVEKVDRVTRNFRDAAKLDNWLYGRH